MPHRPVLRSGAATDRVTSDPLKQQQITHLRAISSSFSNDGHERIPLGENAHRARLGPFEHTSSRLLTRRPERKAAFHARSLAPDIRASTRSAASYIGSIGSRRALQGGVRREDTDNGNCDRGGRSRGRPGDRGAAAGQAGPRARGRRHGPVERPARERARPRRRRPARPRRTTRSPAGRRSAAWRSAWSRVRARSRRAAPSSTSARRSLERRLEETAAAHERHVRALERLSGLSASQAKHLLLKELEDQIRHDSARLVRQIEEETKRDADRRVRNILAVVMQRLAAGHAAETTVSVVQLPADDMKGRIIGREGRNIRALEHLTGVDFIIDDTPNAVILSGFDGVRREIARMTLEKLLSDGRIHPARIEETYYQAKSELESHIIESGEQAALDANVQGLDAELVRILGRLKYRTSYGQNVLAHSIECAHLAAMMADELGASAQDRPPRRAAARHRQGRLARDRGPARARRRRPGAPPRRVRGGRARDGGPPQRGRAADRRGRDRPGRRRALRRPPRRPRRVAGAVRQAPARPRADRHAPRRRRQGLRDAGRPRDPRDGRARARSTTTARSCSATRSPARSSRSSSTRARSRSP